VSSVEVGSGQKLVATIKARGRAEMVRKPDGTLEEKMAVERVDLNVVDEEEPFIVPQSWESFGI